MEYKILGKLSDFDDLKTTIERLEYNGYNISNSDIELDDILSSDVIYKNNYLKNENNEPDLSEDFHSVLTKTLNGQYLYIHGRECERVGYDCGCLGRNYKISIIVNNSLNLLIDNLKCSDDDILLKYKDLKF